MIEKRWQRQRTRPNWAAAGITKSPACVESGQRIGQVGVEVLEHKHLRIVAA